MGYKVPNSPDNLAEQLRADHKPAVLHFLRLCRSGSANAASLSFARSSFQLAFGTQIMRALAKSPSWRNVELDPVAGDFESYFQRFMNDIAVTERRWYIAGLANPSKQWNKKLGGITFEALVDTHLQYFLDLGTPKIRG